MYEDRTQDTILKELLENMPDSYDKSVGYLVYELNKTFSIEISKMYDGMKDIIDKIDVDNLHGEELDKFILQRKNVARRQAKKSLGQLTVIGDGTITKGDIFETLAGTQFESLETKVISGSGTISIISILPGSFNNVPANQITQIPVTIPGIISINNNNTTTSGLDSEDDESLRQRYYESLRLPATSGNISNYILWSKEIEGVGDVRVFPLDNGDNTVTVMIIDTNGLPASDEIVNQVQTYLDPLDLDGNPQGKGTNVTPIGAYVTVVKPNAINVDIDLNIRTELNYTADEIKANIRTNLNDYFKTIAFKENFVSYARIGALIFQTEGVSDYSDLTINNGVSNIDISEREVATLGTVTLNLL